MPGSGKIFSENTNTTETREHQKVLSKIELKRKQLQEKAPQLMNELTKLEENLVNHEKEEQRRIKSKKNNQNRTNKSKKMINNNSNYNSNNNNYITKIWEKNEVLNFDIMWYKKTKKIKKTKRNITSRSETQNILPNNQNSNVEYNNLFENIVCLINSDIKDLNHRKILLINNVPINNWSNLQDLFKILKKTNQRPSIEITFGKKLPFIENLFTFEKINSRLIPEKIINIFSKPEHQINENLSIMNYINDILIENGIELDYTNINFPSIIYYPEGKNNNWLSKIYSNPNNYRINIEFNKSYFEKFLVEKIKYYLKEFEDLWKDLAIIDLENDSDITANIIEQNNRNGLGIQLNIKIELRDMDAWYMKLLGLNLNTLNIKITIDIKSFQLLYKDLDINIKKNIGLFIGIYDDHNNILNLNRAVKGFIHKFWNTVASRSGGLVPQYNEMNQDNRNEYELLSESLDRLTAFIMLVIKYNLKNNIAEMEPEIYKKLKLKWSSLIEHENEKGYVTVKTVNLEKARNRFKILDLDLNYNLNDIQSIPKDIKENIHKNLDELKKYNKQFKDLLDEIPEKLYFRFLSNSEYLKLCNLTMENFNIRFDSNLDSSIENKADTFTLQLDNNNFCYELGKLLVSAGKIIIPLNAFSEIF